MLRWLPASGECKTTGRPWSVFEDSFKSPEKMQRPRHFSCDDDVSTAAPSPWTGPYDSPWCSPAYGPDMKHGVLQFPEGSSGIDFELPPSPPMTDAVAVDSSEPLWWEAVAKAVDAVVPVDSPTSTPRKIYCPYPSSPPPAPKMVTPVPELRKALTSNSAQQVREALLDDPDCARFPFWDHGMEPPLCWAIRSRCSAEIVGLLLQNGAEQDATNLQKRTPADLLRSLRDATNGAPYADIRKVEQMLGVEPASQPPMASTPTDFLSNSWFAQQQPPPWANLDQQLPATALMPRELLF